MILVFVDSCVDLCLKAEFKLILEYHLDIMPQRRHLTNNERRRALGCLQAGQTQRQVAAQFNVSQSVIGRLWQVYLDTGDVQRRPGQGRPRVTTDAQDRRLSLMA